MQTTGVCIGEAYSIEGSAEYSHRPGRMTPHSRIKVSGYGASWAKVIVRRIGLLSTRGAKPMT